MPSITFKELVYTGYVISLNNKIALIKKIISDALEMSNTQIPESCLNTTEPKNIATGTQYFRQLLDKTVNDAEQVRSINIQPKSDVVIFGSLIKTNYEFIFIAAGEDNKFFGEIVTVIDAYSEIGKRLVGLKEGERFYFAGKEYIIKGIR